MPAVTQLHIRNASDEHTIPKNSILNHTDGMVNVSIVRFDFSKSRNGRAVMNP